MENRHFDDLVRGLALPRRSLLASALALVSSQLGLASGDARKKRKRRKPKSKPKPNEFGCLELSDACRTSAQCCSGICAGRKGTKRCRAHDTGGCQPGAEPQECSGEEMDVVCTTSAGKQGICGTTTGNAGYCLSAVRCWPCKTDRDCQTAYGGAFGPNAACARCALCENVGGTICVFPERLPETISGLTTVDPYQDHLAAHRATREERP